MRSHTPQPRRPRCQTIFRGDSSDQNEQRKSSGWKFVRSTSLDIALMRTRFDEIDEQKIYEKGQRLGKKIGECIGERIGRQQGERKGEARQKRTTLRQMLSFQISIGEKETDLLQQLNGDELLILSERYEMIKTSEDLADRFVRL